MRSARVVMLAAVLSAAMVATAAGPARAEVVEEAPEAQVSGDFVDAWSLVGNTVTALLGSRSCTVTASTPVNSANQVAGSGSVSCTKRYAKLTLTVCIQAKQAFVSEETTWEDQRCNPTKAALNSSSLNDTVVAPCLPGPWRYRTKVTAEGFNADSSEPVFTAMIMSGSALYDCFL